jgi:ornithine--oxo-acid transaminase
VLRARAAPPSGRGLTTAVEDAHVARNYAPFAVRFVRGDGVWLVDGGGRRYLDLLAGYSASSFGHGHPRLTAAAHAQLDRLTLTGRAHRNDQLGPFCRDLASLCGKDAVLPVNTGAEAVETAIKIARRWGYQVKGVRPDAASIVVFDGNFHGRTTTIVGFSSDAEVRRDFGPFTEGFRRVRYGRVADVATAVDDTTVAVLVEPIQGEAGVVVPPDGFLAGLAELCADRQVLFVADEIQSGLGRTGRTFACDHEGVVPDLYLLGKALGGGIVPLSAVVGDWSVLGVLDPGSHGSTFGGNPLACAVGREVVAMLGGGELQDRAAILGARLHAGLAQLAPEGIAEVRGRGLWAGLLLVPELVPARRVCEVLLEQGLVTKEAHDTVVRVSPPLIIDERELDWGLERLAEGMSLVWQEVTR